MDHEGELTGAVAQVVANKKAGVPNPLGGAAARSVANKAAGISSPLTGAVARAVATVGKSDHRYIQLRDDKMFVAKVKGKWIGIYLTLEQAIAARNEYCTENEIPIPNP
jgi:hypothetical protein